MGVTRLSVRVPSEILAQLDRLAAERRWSRSVTVRVAVERFLRENPPAADSVAGWTRSETKVPDRQPVRSGEKPSKAALVAELRQKMGAIETGSCAHTNYRSDQGRRLWCKDCGAEVKR